MSWDKFSDECDGCKPAILNLNTGKCEPDDSPIMLAVFKIWEETTLEERQAYHRVCCQQSKDSADIQVAIGIAKKIELALASLN